MNASEAKEIEIIAGCEYPGKAGAVLVPRLVDSNKKIVLYTNSITNDLHEVSFELFKKLVRLPEEKEPASKEKEMCKCGHTKSAHKDGNRYPCSTCYCGGFEPAKVESGDALPPLTGISGDLPLKVTTVLNCLTQRENQLRATLLRENGMKEEIERLKGLLSDISYYAPPELCTSSEDDPRISLWAQIRAAVTGEQP